MKEKKIYFNSKIAARDLLTYLQGHQKDAPEFYNAISPMLQVQTLDKTEMIVREGEVCTNVFWVQMGYGRYFKIITDEDGLTDEETIDFCKPGKMLIINECYFNESPSSFYLQFAAGTVIIPFEKDWFETLKLNSPQATTLASKILALDKPESQRIMRMLKMKPRERYREFLRLFDVDIEQYFAVKHIASFLGMRPSYLSRLRGEYFKNKTEVTKSLQAVFFILSFM